LRRDNVELADGITREDLNLFLQEAEEQIQLLDRNILKMEKEANDNNLLQEIFRAAHTIKGSSAMIGHTMMAQLAHAMESVLDQLRKKTMTVTADVIDALLNSLDLLRSLKEDLISFDDRPVDINTVIAQLSGLNTENNNSVAPAGNGKTEKEFINNEFDCNINLESIQSSGGNVQHIKITLQKETEWASVRCFQIIQELSQTGEIIASVPSLKDIEEEKAGHLIQLLLNSTYQENDIKKAIISVPDIEDIEISPYVNKNAAPVKKETSEKNDTAPSRKEDSKLNQTVRVDVNRLDLLMEQIGELVINRNRIGQISKILEEKYRGDELVHDLGKTSSQVGKIVSVLQQDIMKIRMLPIEIVFNAFPRMIRDLARKANKNVEFIMEGQDTEVDRSVIEHLRDPLVHLLRNAVDHGVELQEERRAAGKPDIATIKLSAYHEQDHIKIVIEDDGKGLNPENIKNSAVKKGFISADMAAKLTEAEAINLIFTSGVSTARKTTEISGRGVGMDIVKTNIESINGSILVDSQPGKGTKFTLVLPLTLAIIPALLVSLNHSMCAIPLINIVETAQLKNENIQTIRGQEVIILRGNVLPLIRLNDIFGWAKEDDERTETKYIVVVKSDEAILGLVVNSLIEEQEIVVKSLGTFLGEVKGITGASIMGDGQVVLILDTTSIIKDNLTNPYKKAMETACLTV
jgi:two-component system chemotaxis sensor kinase CheA